MRKKKRFRDVKNKNISQEHKTQKNIEKDVSSYASIGTRTKAFITDIFMLLMPLMYIVTYIVIGSLQEFATERLEGWIYILIPNFIIVTLFFYKSGQTPGCRAYAIKLVDSKTLEKPHFLSIVLRYYFQLFSIISIFGLLIAFFRKDKKTLHDLLSGTVLIKTEQEKTLKQ